MNQSLLIPGSIVIAGLAIGAAIFLSGPSAPATGTIVAHAAEREEDSHIFGNPDAEITIVEFSDYECPFCGRLHPTLERIVAESDGRINWEYRHLPLPSHRNAEEAAASAECVARLLGNDAFWDYSNQLFGNQRGLNTNFFVSEATALGIDQSAFEECVRSDEVRSVVLNDLRAAQSLGGSGTPFSVIVFPDGSTRPVRGALPYEHWQSLLNPAS